MKTNHTNREVTIPPLDACHNTISPSVISLSRKRLFHTVDLNSSMKLMQGGHKSPTM